MKNVLLTVFNYFVRVAKLTLSLAVFEKNARILFTTMVKTLGSFPIKNYDFSITNWTRTNLKTLFYIGTSNKYIFRVGVGDILILLTV
jgi:hypothetical protein